MKDEEDRFVFFQISPRKVGIVLASLVLCAGAGYAATKFAEWFAKPDRDFGLYKFFDLGGEANFPTFISTLLLFVAASLLALIARHKSDSNRKLARPWIGLALGFAYLSVDEAAQIHEGIIGPLFLTYFGGEGWFWHWGWYVPFIPIVLILGAVYIPFLKALPIRYTILFVMSGSLFVGGAIGVEMVESYISYNLVGGGAMALALLIEEMCEMFGVVLFIYALLTYIAESGVRYSFYGIDLDEQVNSRKSEKVGESVIT